MKPEQRLLLAVALTLGILMAWSVMAPPARQVPAGPPQGTPLQRRSEGDTRLEPALMPEEPVEAFQVGGAEFRVGSEYGEIKSLAVNGTTLLSGASPGLLWLENSRATLFRWIRMQTRLEGGVLRSEGTRYIPGVGRPSTEYAMSLGVVGNEGVEGLRITRELSVETAQNPWVFRVSIKAQNPFPDALEGGLRVVVYQALQAAASERGQYLSGTVYAEGKAQRITVRPGQSRRFEGPVDWVSSQNRSHAVILQPKGFHGVFHVEHQGVEGVVGWLELPVGTLGPSESKEWVFRLYAGPAALASLKQAGLEEALSFGAFSGVARMLLSFLHWANGWLHNYGWAICLLSVAIWLPFAPMTWYGMRLSQQTMQRMAKVRPHEARIRTEHAKNPQRMQQEIFQLYRKHGINPATGCMGCLPFLFTWPVYIALFQVLTRAPELQGAAFLWIRDLSAPDALIRFPTAVPLIGESLNLLPILATAGTFLQQKMMQRPTTELTDEQRVQQQMFRFLPLMFLFFFYHLPAGFMLYWVVNTVLMVGQQRMIVRSIQPS